MSEEDEVFDRDQSDTNQSGNLNDSSGTLLNRDDEPQWARARMVDSRVYAIESALVTLAALAMVSTVSLDILFRSLKSQQTEPMQSLLTGFGLFSVDQMTQDAPIAIMPVLLFVSITFGGGWAIYQSRHRGGDRNNKASIYWGIFVCALSYVFCVLIRVVPSKWVCSGLSILIATGVGFEAYRMRSYLFVIFSGVLGLLSAKLCLKLPQDYIWSQELSLILLAWVAFLGASMATYQSKHIEISALAKLIPKRFQKWVRPISLIMTGFFCAYLTVILYESVFGATGSYKMGETRPATGIPAWVILTSGVISFSTMTVRSIAYGIYGLLHANNVKPTEDLH